MAARISEETTKPTQQRTLYSGERSSRVLTIRASSSEITLVAVAHGPSDRPSNTVQHRPEERLLWEIGQAAGPLGAGVHLCLIIPHVVRVLPVKTGHFLLLFCLLKPMKRKIEPTSSGQKRLCKIADPVAKWLRKGPACKVVVLHSWCVSAHLESY